MAQNVSVCVSTDRSAPGSSGQSSSTMVLPLTDIISLAEQSLVLFGSGQYLNIFRRLYATKWGVFKRWCTACHADPVDCQIVSMLDFLQGKISAGTWPTTLRAFVAAISACHALIDRVPVMKYPLIACFIHGARQLRLPVRAKITLWNLAIVLEGLLHRSRRNFTDCVETEQIFICYGGHNREEAAIKQTMSHWVPLP